MRHLSRLLFLPLGAVLGTGCFVNTGPDVEKNPCDPNPCTQGDKTQCVNEDGNARCLCKPGTVLRPSGACEPLTAVNCPEHGGDTSEPDDCLSRAAPLATNVQRQQSIEPVGDYDFFKIDGTVDNVYTVTVEPGPGSLMPRVDVFDQGGEWIRAHDGRPKAQVGFKARASAPYYVRVSHSPMDASAATGAYALTSSLVGKDDYGDLPADSTLFVPDVGGTNTPNTRYGRFEYGQDEDWIALDVTQGTTYRIEFDTSRFLPALAAFTREDVKNPFRTARAAYVDISSPGGNTRVYLNLYSPQAEPGSYAFRLFRY
ncbi:hypothetical protein JRI60_32615 [Archangium violaceum]|uniref:hypothetical protein n=1 Tax=Archangium violaceum TaxID=83451 RepID=UPI00195032C9|nr:hypothetical protein [Archangium violaceum]QRN93885.1 hypothetical protein JRI60_32615 [Archangium violaceum]